MKKALVYYLYGNRNAGDMAICLGAIELLQKQGYAVTMVSRFSEAEEEYHKSKAYLSEYYPDVSVYPGPFSFDRDFSRIKKIGAYAKSMMKVMGLIQDKTTSRLISDADVVFFNGGNLLRGATLADYMRLVALFYPIKKAKSKGKTIYCLPQSTAKISNFGEKILGRYLRFFDKIFVREKISFDELKKRFSGMSFVRSTDLAFLCNDTPTAEKRYRDLALEIEKKTIAVVVRNTGIGDIGELDAEKQDLLLKQLMAVVNEHEDYQYLVVVQTEKDRAFSHKAMEAIGAAHTVQMIESHDPLVLREIYKRVECLITMRLHAAILSLSAFTPVTGTV